MRRFASASPTCIALPAFQSSAERIALGAERQSLHDAFKRETPPPIVDTARDSPVDWIAAELAVAEDRSWPSRAACQWPAWGDQTMKVCLPDDSRGAWWRAHDPILTLRSRN